MQEITRVGVDLAKRVIQVLAVNAAGSRVTGRALAREKFLPWCAQLPPGCLVAMEASSSAHHWARIQTHGYELARPVVGAGTRLHRHHASRWQLGAPGHEFVTRQGAIRYHFACRIDSMNLNDVFGQIGTNSCNLGHGTSPSLKVSD